MWLISRQLGARKNHTGVFTWAIMVFHSLKSPVFINKVGIYPQLIIIAFPLFLPSFKNGDLVFMSIIQQIRDKYAAVGFGAIALSLIAFILMDAGKSGSGGY